MTKKNQISEPSGTLMDKGKTANVRGFENTRLLEAEVSLANEIGAVINGTIKSRLDQVVKSSNEAMVLIVKAGLSLISIKRECEYGEFVTQIEKRGIQERRAQEMMNYARFAASLPDGQRAKLMELPKTKAMLLASADAEVIEEYLDDDDSFADLQGLTVRDLKQELRQAKAAIADANVKNDTLQNDLKQAAQKRSSALSGGAVPLFVEDTRHEAAALNHKICLCVDDMQRMNGELLQMTPGNKERHFHDMAAKALYHSLNHAVVHAATLLKEMQGAYGDAVTGEVNAHDTLCDAEALRLAHDFSLITQEHEHEKLLRAQAREAKRPRGRGRPKKDVQS